MKVYLKKVTSVFLLIGTIILSSLNVDANTDISKITFLDAYLTFDVWQGKGSASVTIGDDFLTKDKDIVKFSEFQKLKYSEKEIDSSNYTITESGDNIVITFKEEYLSTLDDGTYLYEVIFSKAIIPIRLHVVTHKISLTDAYFSFPIWTGKGTVQVDLIPEFFSCTFYSELFNELQYKGNKVDKSNYSISQFQNTTRIMLKEEYLKTLADGEHYFTADFINVNVKLKLTIEKNKLKNEMKNPAKVKKVKAFSKKKKLKIKWKKQKNATGYIIKIGTNKKITRNKKVVTIKRNKSEWVVKGLKKKKKYYFKVRSYKVIDGKKYYGEWSVKKSKITK